MAAFGTPRPWDFVPSPGQPTTAPESYDLIREGKEELRYMILVLPDDISPSDFTTDVAFIRKAVRNHDALLAACKLARDRIRSVGMDWLGKGEDPLDKAIRKAEE